MMCSGSEGRERCSTGSATASYSTTSTPGDM